ncbi:hypothetical protein GV828_09165, partial [Flavobacterium sp. NST-5]|nr:hypothetical protein [Flavobacterium ichthyis]
NLENDQAITNIVYFSQNGNDFDYKVIRYFPSDNWLESYRNNPNTLFSGTIEGFNSTQVELSGVTYAKGGSMQCPIAQIPVWICAANNAHSFDDYVSGVCRVGENRIVAYNTVWGDCPNSGGGEGSGGGNPGNNGNPGQEIIEIPTKPVVFQSFFQTFYNNSLNFAQQQYLNDYPDVKADIENYIDAQGTINGVVSNEAMGFTKSAIDALIEGGAVDFALQVIIDPSFSNNSILMNVYNLFGGMPTFKNYLQNFEGSFSVAHLKLAAASDLPDNANAQTSLPENYVVTITFNTDNLNRPNLSIARTMIHEIIHAEIFRKLLSNYNQPSLDGLTYSDIIAMKDNFPGIYDYYIRWRQNIPAGMNINSAQHQMMAQHYRNIIVQAMKEFDNSYSEELYQALAWVGLMGSGTMDETTGLPAQPTLSWQNVPQQERLQIRQIIRDFEN